ncbi:MAG TPA: ParB/RepB/Spo0J family partition protein [Pyrinomonadaceae bacterium]|nr:ParB/RepB/Spo0J family partition protein [Pyrinomonadaceae bacterium]
MTRRALGRGLSALLSDRPAMTNEEMTEVDIDLIEPNSFQPRTNFNEERLEELAQSIRSNGVIQPLLVRKITGEKYQLVAGERRWRAAQRANLQRVPCVIKEIPEDKMLELALIENIQRQELNAIEEAYAYKRLIETLEITQEVLAQRVGRDRTFITNYLRLLRLPEDIQHLVESEKLSMGHARALLGVDDPDIQRKLAKNILDKGLSVRQTERAIKEIIEGTDLTPGTSTHVEKDVNLKFAEDKLRRKLSSKVHIILQKGGKGKIEIEFYDEDDLNRLYQTIIGKEVV